MPIPALIPQKDDSSEILNSPAPEEGQVLVLEPVGNLAGTTPILLDARRQFIGTDDVCAIQLPAENIRPRHAVILRGRRLNIIKAFDQQTWLNGLPITESLLRHGDRLTTGPFDFQVREATGGEMPPQGPPVVDRPVAGADHDVDSRLAMRRERLSAIRARLKERREQLRRDHASLQAERARFELSKAQAGTAGNEFVGTSGKIDLVPPPAGESAERPRGNAVTKNWERDVERVQHLFHTPGSRSAAGLPDPGMRCPQTSAPAQPVDVHAETANTVNDYMQQLLSRQRAERAEPERPAEYEPCAAQTGVAGVAAGFGHRDGTGAGEVAGASAVLTSQAFQASEPDTEAVEGKEAVGVDAEMAAAHGAQRARRQVAINELRAGVGSLREVANISARTAVARHTSQKLRRMSIGTLVLTTISFVLVGVFAFLGESDARCYGLAFGAMMAGVILLIEFWYKVWKIKNMHAGGPAPANRCKEEKSLAAESTAGGPTPPLSSP